MLGRLSPDGFVNIEVIRIASGNACFAESRRHHFGKECLGDH